MKYNSIKLLNNNFIIKYMSVIKNLTNRNELKQLINKHADKTIFIKYSAKWCGHCNRIHNDILRLFENYNKPKLLVLVDIDEADDIASAMRINSIPVIQTFKEGYPDNVVIGADINEIKSLFKNT